MEAIRLLWTIGNVLYWPIVAGWIWHWFIVPFGIPDIGYLWMMGLGVAIRFLVLPSKYQEVLFWNEQDDRTKIKAAIYSTMYITYAWGIAYTIHLLMTIKVDW